MRKLLNQNSLRANHNASSGARHSSPSGSIKGDVKKKHPSSSARRGYFSDIQPPSADARILAGARLGRTDFAGGCGIMN